MRETKRRAEGWREERERKKDRGDEEMGQTEEVFQSSRTARWMKRMQRREWMKRRKRVMDGVRKSVGGIELESGVRRSEKLQSESVTITPC